MNQVLISDSGPPLVFCLLKETSFTLADPNAYLEKSFPLAASSVAGKEQKDKEHVRKENENHWSCSSELRTALLFPYATAIDQLDPKNSALSGSLGYLM